MASTNHHICTRWGSDHNCHNDLIQGSCVVGKDQISHTRSYDLLSLMQFAREIISIYIKYLHCSVNIDTRYAGHTDTCRF